MHITIAAAQYPITEHASFHAWKDHLSRWLHRAAEQQADLVLFPEYGSMELVSLFSEKVRTDLRRQVTELNEIKDDFCGAFSDLAKQFGIYIVAPSLPVMAEGRQINRAYVFSPTGASSFQDKLFMTRFENEEWGIESGKKQLTLFETEWGSFGVQICYDVEFPVGSRLLAEAGASVILAPSCTETLRGATRVHVGARARALENQLYVAVSQTIGNAAWSPAVDINYGYAAFYSTPDKNLPEDGIVSSMAPQAEGWLVQRLDLSLLETVRSDGQVFNFKDMSRLQSGWTDEAIIVSRQRI